MAPHAVSAATSPGRSEWISDIIEAPDISSLALSPDGRRLAFRTEEADVDQNGYLLEWHILDLQTGLDRKIADGGDAIFDDPGILSASPPIWSPDSRFVHYRKLDHGEVQIWRCAADGSREERLTFEAGDIERLQLAADGSAIEFAAGPSRAAIRQAEQSEYEDGILVDEHVELGQNVFRGAIINGRHQSQRLTGSWFQRGGLLWRVSPAWKRLAFGSTESIPFEKAPVEKFGPGETGAFSRSGARALLDFEGKPGISYISLRGKAAACKARACTMPRKSWLAFVPGEAKLIFSTSDDFHAQKLWSWSPATGRVMLIAHGRGLLSGGRGGREACAISHTHAYCVEAAPGLPPRLVAIDLASGSINPIFDPNKELRLRSSPRIEHLAWTSRDGHKFSGLLFLPAVRPGQQPLPLFINYYRCEGFIRGGLGDEWPFAAMAMHGIAAACINAARLDGPQDGVGQYRVALGGIEALIRQLSARGLVDSHRVGIGGLSFGSEVAMWAAIHSDLIAAVSIASPQFEPATYWFNGVRGRDHHQLVKKVWGLGSPEETPEQWKLVSPALNAERIKAPVLMQLPEQEARYAVELYARLSNSSTPTELYVFPDEPHLKTQPRHRFATYQRNLDWFRFWLRHEEDDDPAKAGQYQRWNFLRDRQQLSRGSGATSPSKPGQIP